MASTPLQGDYARLTLQLPRSIRDRLEVEAQRQRRSLSGQAAVLLEQGLAPSRLGISLNEAITTPMPVEVAE
jgi:hypothetical protein